VTAGVPTAQRAVSNVGTLRCEFQQFIPFGATINFINGFTLLLHRAALAGSLSNICSNNTAFYNAVFQFIT
jgi:hypothetical protein